MKLLYNKLERFVIYEGQQLLATTSYCTETQDSSMCITKEPHISLANPGSYPFS